MTLMAVSYTHLDVYKRQIISCYKGYHASKGTVGVGKAANQAVVFAMIAIFLEETVIVQFINSFLR